jgi:mono/diheme cytochrome c family protein
MRIVLSLVLVIAVTGCAKGSSAANAAAAAKNPASASDGAAVYLANCSSCHQSDGKGVAGAFPPLAGNPTVTGNPVAAIEIVKNGLEGRLVVRGATYSGIMPSWKHQLSDDQIASVVTYIRSAWNNNATGVSVDQVQAIK